MASSPKNPPPAAPAARTTAKKPAVTGKTPAKTPPAPAAAKARVAKTTSPKPAAKSAPKSAPKTTSSRRPRSATTHSAAVNRMLRATGLANVPEEAPLVALVKTLASEMDKSPGSRTRAEYLSALKDVRRVLSFGTGRPVRSSPDAPAQQTPPPSAEAAPPEEDADDGATLSSLAKFKQKRGIG